MIGIDPIEIISGSLPRRQERLVEAWAELHQGELSVDWRDFKQVVPLYLLSHYAEDRTF